MTDTAETNALDNSTGIMAIKTFGAFSVSLGDTVISENITRSKKIWKIFKYLITNRHKMVPIETLIEVLWPDEEPENPEKSLFTLMSRLRKILHVSGNDETHIVFSHNSYQWNNELPVYLDVAEFEKAHNQAGVMQADDDKLPFLLKAIDIYTGDYLPDSAYETWILPVTNYYKRLYLSCVLDLADIYARSSQFEDIIWLCTKAIQHEPYEEIIRGRLIQALSINGDINEAKKHYQHFNDMIKKEFGAQPSEEFRSLCQGIWEVEGGQLEISAIKNKLDEGSKRRGVFFCTTDIFDQIYQIDKRSDERLKFPVFLGLMTIQFKKKDIVNKTLRTAMFTLRNSIMRTLRQGDVVSQYSKNQYVLLLSAYLLKDAESALTRIKRMFAMDYSGEPCEIDINISQIGGSPVK